ncbi:MAG: hypothetical protein P8L37_00600 [Phycisphaerales bacterium]|nr:hypothetical protein [Phycisphaerales bacterium]
MTEQPMRDQGSGLIEPWHSCSIQVGGCTAKCTCGDCEYFHLSPAEDGQRINVQFEGWPGSAPNDCTNRTPVSWEDVEASEEATKLWNEGKTPIMTVSCGDFAVEGGFAGFVRENIGSACYDGLGEVNLGGRVTCESLDQEQREFFATTISIQHMNIGYVLARFVDEDRRRLFWRWPGSYFSPELEDLVMQSLESIGLEEDWEALSRDLVVDVPADVECLSVDQLSSLFGSGRSLCIGYKNPHNGMDWKQPYAAPIISIMKLLEVAEFGSIEKKLCWSELLSGFRHLTDPGIDFQQTHLIHQLFPGIDERDWEGGPGTFIRVSIEVDDRSEILAELKTLASRLSEWVRDVA